ncbi:MAG TPA: efflux RND transporter permease subunit [Longimicrobiales bacterium]
MIISDFAIKRPIITVVTMLFLSIFGLYALSQLQTDEFPDIQNPIIAVSVPYPGASPETVEREVVDRMEEAISGLNGIDQITSSATDGFASIIVQFKFGKPVDEASSDVRDAISSIRGDLPQEIKEPILRRFDPADFPIVTLTLSSPSMTQAQLTQLADPTIKRAIAGVSGVATVNIVGGATRELTVELRPQDLAAAGVSVGQVVAALQAQNLAAPVGSVNGTTVEKTIRLEGRLQRPEDFLNLVVAQRGGQIIRLGQVANVADGTEEPRSMALYNGRPAVGIEILKSKGQSTTHVAEGILQAADRLQKGLPPGAKLDVVQNSGRRVAHSVANVEDTLFIGALLTILVVFLFLNSWRSTVITGLALPVSVLAAFIPVWIWGFTLNTMSLLGLSLAIGILIDDAIVVRENIVRHIEMGEDHYEASRKGTSEIGLAVAATTFSIVAVFLPIAFMYGIGGQWFKPFALTIACAVLVSLFVSFSLDPMLSAYWADPQTEAHERRNPISRALDRFNTWFDKQADNYTRLIAWALDHRWSMVGIATGAMVLALAVQVLFGGFGFIPDSDNSELNIEVQTPPGSNLAYEHLKAEEVAALIRRHPEVAYIYSRLGSTTGSGGTDDGQLYVKLVDKGDRHISQSQLAAVLRKELRQVGGATAWVFSGGMGGPMKSLQVQVTGPDARTLTALAERMATVVRAVPGAADVGLSTRGQKPELDVQINRGLAGSIGVSVGQIAQALRPAFAGIKAGDWVDPSGETRDVEVRLTPEARQRAADLRQLPLVLGSAGPVQGGATGPSLAPAGAMNTVPLEQVATVTQSLGPAQISHLNRDKVVTIGANIDAGYTLGRVTQAVNAALAKNVPLPPGYRITQGGDVKNQVEVFTRIFAALGFALLLMYLILVVQFGSFLDPFAIMLSLPLSLIGVVLALLITRDSLNIMSMIGIILLAGIVAKNAILLIDFAKWGRERGMPLREALIQAGRIRLRPIMMTTLALIAGMFPVALGLGEGADFRAPLGRAVIGGVITSTILTLVVIPTVYEILDGWKEWVLAKLRGKVHVPHGHVGPEPLPEPGD